MDCIKKCCYIGILFLLIACATVRLEYAAKVQIASERLSPDSVHPTYALYKYAASTAVGNHRWLCWGTGIFAGGWCWTYLAMPLDDQKAQISLVAQEKLHDLLPTQRFVIDDDSVARINWQKASAVWNLENIGTDSGAVNPL